MSSIALYTGPLLTEAKRQSSYIDLTSSKVVFKLPDTRSMPPDRMRQLLGPVKAENLTPLDGSLSPQAPRQVVQSPDLSGLDYYVLTKIRITDFGKVFFADRAPSSLGSPVSFFPPAVCFGYPPSTQSDV